MRHGYAKRGEKGAEYRCWTRIWNRCRDANVPEYPNYGGRGITVCDRWRDFLSFLADMGARPSADHSIDRIDTNGNYEPSNCRWATKVEQCRNRRTNRKVTAFGETKLVVEWAEERGIRMGTLHRRLKLGWPPERAISEPIKREAPHILEAMEPLVEMAPHVAHKLRKRRAA